MPTYTTIDQMGREVNVSFPPQRIISLVPSQTELLFDLGLDEEIVGITKFCVHPKAQFRKKYKVGGTKTIHLERVEALAPDLIIGNKEENEQSQIEALALRYSVWMSDVYDLASALDMIRQVGVLCKRIKAAERLVQDIAGCFDALPVRVALPCAAYLIWRKPFMVAARHTFIDAMLPYAGFSNAFGDLERYPEISLELLAQRQPAHILLSSEPYPFQEKHFAEFREACPDARIAVVDGEFFSWYGSRLLKSAAYFQRMG